MNTKIKPNKLEGIVDAMPSKSHAHRILIAQKLAEIQRNPDEQFNSFYIPDFSRDIEATKNCLLQLNKSMPFLDCGESGSTLRFMLPVAMALKEKAVFMGSGKLPYRPIEPLKAVMEKAGCHFVMSNQKKNMGVKYKEICTITGLMNSGDYSIAGNESSQYITGLLFALPILDGDSTLTLTSPLESANYVNMTLEVLASFGITIECFESEEGMIQYRIPGNQLYVEPENLKLQGDWSNGAFWLVCGALGSKITCRGLSMSSAQGDKEILNILQSMGAHIDIQPISEYGDEVFVSCSAPDDGILKAVDVDISQTPDLAPVLAVAMSLADGASMIYNAGRLKLKESNRIKAIFDFLDALGADISYGGSSISLTGVPYLGGGEIDSCNDHRIAMAAAIAASCCHEAVTICNSEAVNKSYPDFFKDYGALGGEII